MIEEKAVLASDPSWYWVQVKYDDISAFREKGHVVIARNGGFLRTSVPILGDSPENGDPHADKRFA